MDLLKAIVLNLIEDNNIVVIDSEIADKLYFKCYKALNAIREVIRNDDITDFECVERIVNIFDDLGSDGGNRHNF